MKIMAIVTGLLLGALYLDEVRYHGCHLRTTTAMLYQIAAKFA
jgi:hypothetical protein